MLETELFALLEGTADAAFSVDEQGRIRSWNRAAEKLFGWNQGGGPNVLVQIGYLRDLMPETPPAQPACVPVQASVVSAPEQTKP